MTTCSTSTPCRNCGNTAGGSNVWVKCSNCGTLGCDKCIGQHNTTGTCKVCKKKAERVKV
jgi:hypothetical protein